MRLPPVFLSLLVLLPVSALSAPKADLWPLWDAADDSNAATIDHAAWQAVLDGYLISDHPSGIHRFDYEAVSPQHRAALRTYLERMQALDPRQYSRDEQRAYWINLYNALTVDLVIARWGKPSILRMGKGLFSIGPWNEKIARIAGQKLSLNDIEHRILRPIWRDHRLHYVLNCASLGCPNLAPQAFAAGNTEALLAAAERAYISHPRGVEFEARRLVLSSIYEWYEGDFASSQSGLLEHLAKRAPPELAAQLKAWTGKVRYRYDWALNAP